MAHDHSKHAKKIIHKSLDSHEVSTTLLKGAVMSAGAQTGKSIMSIMSKVTKHPLLLVGIGVGIGYYAHKHRKDIIASVSSVTDKGKDFVLQQRENLEDIVAESKESPE